MPNKIATGIIQTETYVNFLCPGCGHLHELPVKGDASKHPIWQWNGSLDKPTLSPSVLSRGTEWPTPEELERLDRGEAIEPRPYVCHSFVREGMIQFLGDCTHALAGTTVLLYDIEAALNTPTAPGEQA